MDHRSTSDVFPLSSSSKAVAIEILVHGAQSRAQLAQRMGLSAGSLTRLVKPLLEAGVLVESEAVRSSARGRSSLPLDVVPERYRFAGIKLTTDTIYAVVTDLRATIVDEQTVALTSLDIPDVVSAVLDVIGDLQARSDRPFHAVGVTVGGRVEAGEVVADSPFLHWHDVPFRSLLSRELGIPVHLENDVIALTRAQHWFGFGRDHANFALLTIGAGIGYGLVINDALVATAIHPISHFPVDPSGPLCPLGHRGCATAYLTSDAIVSAVSVVHGRAKSYAEVVALARSGDPVASRVVREAARALGRVVSAISALTGVDRIILSGEGVHLVEHAQHALDEGRAEYQVGAGKISAPVVRPMDFLEWARGAAAVAIQQEFPEPRREATASIHGDRVASG